MGAALEGEVRALIYTTAIESRAHLQVPIQKPVASAWLHVAGVQYKKKKANSTFLLLSLQPQIKTACK